MTEIDGQMEKKLNIVRRNQLYVRNAKSNDLQ